MREELKLALSKMTEGIKKSEEKWKDFLNKKVEQTKEIGEDFKDVFQNAFGGNICSEIPVFNNKENEPTLAAFADGSKKIIYNSRSCAVSIAVKNKGEILIGQRSKKMTHPLKWCLPCGYMDWNKDIFQAASRELFEEMGLYIKPEYFRSKGFYEVVTDPKKDDMENITFHFLVDLDMDFEKIKLSLCPNEVVDSKWLALPELNQADLAFNHGSRIINILKNE